MEDRRPDPKPRKRAALWQSYLLWDDLVSMRQRHTLRMKAAEAGKSNLDPQWEADKMDEIGMDQLVNCARKTMVNYAASEPIYAWLTNIKGLGEGSLAAQLISQIDDIGKFDTISKLWRFAGYAVIDGAAEKGQKGQKSTFNHRLKALGYLIAGEQFIKQQTPVYSDIYYAEKERQRRLHPEVMCRQCGIPWAECKSKKAHKQEFNPAHLHNRAWRKTFKIFLSHLWLEWRQLEGLPISDPYIIAAENMHCHVIAA